MISEYTSRNLSFGSDALNAFVGTLSSLEKTPAPKYHIWGVIHYGQADKPSPLLNLAWHHENLVLRRAGFPSWSWTGWKGTVYHSSPEVQTSSCNRDKLVSLKGCLENSNHYEPLHKLLGAELAQRGTLRSFRPSICLQVRGWIVRLSLLSLTNPDRKAATAFQFNPSGKYAPKSIARRESGVYCRLELNSAIEVLAPVQMDSTSVPQQDVCGMFLGNPKHFGWSAPML